MKILYFDCNAGISGDMTLSSLLDLGVDFDYLKNQLALLGIEREYKLTQYKTRKQGICVNQVKIELPPHHHEHHHGRNLMDIFQLIDQSALNTNIKTMAKKMFQIVADAEGAVHGKPAEQVHFHEVGAVDSILDLIGTAICIDILAPDAIYFSVLQEGTGTIQCAHGMMPVPAPATAEIFRQHNIPFQITDETGEMVTPTGAAIVAALSKGFAMPTGGILQGIGYGCGTREFKRANILRTFCFEICEPQEHIMVLETNVDDCTGEAIGFALEQLIEFGALDAFSTPIFMKKGRPAQKITVLCRESDVDHIEDILFTHLTTIGIRKYAVQRRVLPRKMVVCSTEYGKIEAKVSQWNGLDKVSPEFDSVRQIAVESNLSLVDVYDAVKRAYIEGRWKEK